jgi:hypothetical protein
VSRSENLKNQTSSHGHTLEYIKEMPEDAVTVSEYNGHHFEELYYYDTDFYFL